MQEGRCQANIMSSPPAACRSFQPQRWFLHYRNARPSRSYISHIDCNLIRWHLGRKTSKCASTTTF